MLGICHGEQGEEHCKGNPSTEAQAKGYQPQDEEADEELRERIRLGIIECFAAAAKKTFLLASQTS